MIWLLLMGALLPLIWYIFLKPMTYWKDQGVKQTKPWAIFGDSASNLFGQSSFMATVEKIYNLYPNTRYTGCYQFSIPTLLLKDPELIKQITVKDFDHFTDHRAFIDPECDPLIGGMLFLLKGQRWREMRATLSGAFTSSKMKNMFHLMEEAAENFVKYFLDKNEDVLEIEMKDAYTRYTNDVIASTAFGIQCDSLAEPNNEFYLMGKEVTNFNSIKNVLKLFSRVLMPKLFKFLKIPVFDKKVSSFFRRTISETIKIRKEKGVVRQDMINLLLEARNGMKNEEYDDVDTGFATVKESTYNGKVRHIQDLTDEVITSQALIFFAAGFDTISTAMCFGSYELALNKDIQDRLRDEITEAYKHSNEKLTYELLSKMKYFDMVISEILRIWSPVTVLDRCCTKSYTIEPANSDESPVHLKSGDIIMLPVQAIHRDPSFYPNPEKFNPERFSDENKDSISPYTYIPFGSGPRNCIGSRFALLEMKALFFKLLLNFEIVPSKKTQIPIKIKKQGQQPASEGGFWFALKRIRQ